MPERVEKGGWHRFHERERLRRLSPFAVPGHEDELGAFLRRLGVLVALILALQIAGTIGFVLTEQVSV